MADGGKAWGLLPYQARWVRDDSPLKVVVKSRRIGLSWSEAYDAVMRGGAAGGTGDTYYQSYAHDMTRGFLSDCAQWAETVHALADRVGERLIDDEDRQRSVFSLRLSSGRSIEGMSSSPRQFRSRGRPGDTAIIDEAAFVSDLPEVLKAAIAFRIWGGRLRIISTHNGVGSPFARLVEEVEEGSRPGSLHTITLRQALDEGLYRRVCQVSGETWTPDGEAQWEADVRAEYGEDAAEELDCIPAAGGGRWLSWEMIRAAEHEDAGQPDRYQRYLGPVVIGNDIARRRHLWVAVVLQVVGDVAWTREISTLRDATFGEQDQELDRLVARYRPMAVAMDATGLGEKPVEDARARYGASRVEGVHFTAAVQHDLAIALRERLEDGLLRLPAGDAALREDLRSVHRDYGPTGAPRLVADETREADGGTSHADRFWAMALACGAAAQRRGRAVEGHLSALGSGAVWSPPDVSAGREVVDGVLRGGAADLLADMESSGGN